MFNFGKKEDKSKVLSREDEIRTKYGLTEMQAEITENAAISSFGTMNIDYFLERYAPNFIKLIMDSKSNYIWQGKYMELQKRYDELEKKYEYLVRGNQNNQIIK